LKFSHNIFFACCPSGTSCVLTAVICLYNEAKNASSCLAFFFSAFSAYFFDLSSTPKPTF